MSILLSKGLIESRKNGRILIIRPSVQSTPLFCPHCEFPLKTLEDVMSSKNHGACYKCEMRWSGDKNWGFDWKPNKLSTEWEEYILERKLLARNLINLR